MALPHPHGTASGEIGHNANIDTGDTPGSTGGRFIGWGEEGTSAYANRAHWALSENIDYLYDIEIEDRAVAEELTWVVPGGGETKKQIATDVFVGDSGYPADAIEGLAMLFAVLDDDYNELQTAAGEKVYAYQVFDSTDTSTVYKTGFVSSPWVYFATASSTPYTIPASTTVRLVYAGKSNYEDMPVDALTKFWMRAVGELPAGVLLQDGSRKMTGDLDFDGNEAVNIQRVIGRSSYNLQITSLDDLVLKDQHLSSPVGLSQTGVTGINSFSGEKNSIIGLLNDQVDQHHSFGANQRIWDGGNLLTSDGVGVTPRITMPTNDTYAMNGELVVALTTPFDITQGDTWAYVVMHPDGTLEDAAIGDNLHDNNTTVVCVYYYDTGTEFFTSFFDMREMAEGSRRNLEVTFSSDGVYRADFDNFRTALEFFEAIQRLTTGGEGFIHNRFVLRVLGTNTISGDIAHDLSNIDELTIVGDGVRHSEIRVTSPTSTSVHLLDCGNNCILHMSDLTFRWSYGTADQGAGYGVVNDAAGYSTFERIHVLGGTKDWANAFVWLADPGPSYIRISHCLAEVNQCMVTGSDPGAAIPTDNLYGTVVEHCFCQPGNNVNTLASWAFLLPGTDNKVLNCTVATGMHNGIMIGHMGVIEGCYIAASLSNASATIVRPFNGTSGLVSAKIINNTIISGQNGLFVQNDGSYSDPMHVLFEGNTVTATNGVNIGNDSSADAGNVVQISNNRFESCPNYGIYGYYARGLLVKGNSFVNHTGTGIFSGIGTLLMAEGNYFEGFGHEGGSLYPHAIYVDISVGTAGPHIKGNFIGNAGDTLPANSTAIVVKAGRSIIEGNTIEMVQSVSSDHDGIGLIGTATNHRHHIVSGNVIMYGRTGLTISGAWSNIYGIAVNNNQFIQQQKFGITVSQSGLITIDGNHFQAIQGCAVDVSNSSDGEMVSISDNTFAYCHGDKTDSGLGVSAVLFLDATGGSNDTMSRIIGNTFYACGHPLAAASEVHHIIYVNRSAVIKGNVVNDIVGNSSNTDDLRMFRLRGTGIIAENLFDINLASAFGNMPAKFSGIRFEGDGVVVMGNVFNYHGTPGGVFAECNCIISDASAGEARYVANSSVVVLPATATIKKFITDNGDDAVFLANYAAGGNTEYALGLNYHPPTSAWSTEIAWNNLNGTV